MYINYDMMDPKIRKTVENMEAKPHIKWIRYLLSKRYSPISIRRELQRLGLSTPHEKPIIIYYLAVIDPIVKKYKLGSVYADYKRKLTSKNKRGAYALHILKYRLEDAIIDNPTTEANFCRFVNELEISECWSTEIIRYYGKVENVPTDDYGNKIIKANFYKRSMDKLLMHPKRYLIDKMLLENVPNNRIVDYVNKNFKDMKIFEYDIRYYKEIFFNTRNYDTEGKIKLISAEKNELEIMYNSVEADEDIELGEKTAILSKTKERIKELEENIKMLNSMYSESAMRSLELQRENIPKLFEEIIYAGYKRFENLDQYKDRDVVDPLMKITRMMGYAFEKSEESRKSINSANDMTRDSAKNETMMGLYRSRVEEYYQEQQESLKEAQQLFDDSEDLDDITNVEGLEELNISAGVEECEDTIEELDTNSEDFFGENF